MAPSWLRSLFILPVVGIQSEATAGIVERMVRIDCSAKMNFPYDIAVGTRVCILRYCRTLKEWLAKTRIGERTHRNERRMRLLLSNDG